MLIFTAVSFLLKTALTIQEYDKPSMDLEHSQQKNKQVSWTLAKLKLLCIKGQYQQKKQLRWKKILANHEQVSKKGLTLRTFK